VPVNEAVALAALAAVLAVSVARPRGLPEAVVAVPAALLLLVAGVVSGPHARDELGRLAPVVGFLAAVLVLADGCEREGLFRAAGGVMARTARRSPSRLLLSVVGLAALTTAVLSLDTTVVLLTPVVIVTVRATHAPPRPTLYATAHLANTASLLLPVSNLTNLLAVATVDISFPRFAAVMAVPWLVGIAVEVVGVRWLFRRDLASPIEAYDAVPEPFPVVASVIVAVTVIGFAAASLAGLAPVWVAVAGAAVLTLWRASRATSALPAMARDVVRAASPLFCLFVLALGIVVRAVSDNGMAGVIRHLTPNGSDLLALLGVAAVSAVLANVVNNLPATLLLLPVVAVGGAAPVLAMLIGVGIGPNLTYPGSLATLLWRRVVSGVDGVPDLGDYSRLALLTVPAGVGLATVALWLSLRVVGT
jgi:arsenical pump membrane protein